MMQWRNLAVWLLCIFVPVAGQNNAAVIQGRKDLNTLKRALNELGIIARTGKTIFAPNDDAFEAFEENDPIYEKYLEGSWYYHRRELILWHFVTQDKYTVDEIFDGHRARMESTHGNITINQRDETIDGVAKSSILQTLRASDGIIHIIDTLIVPPYLANPILPQLLEDRNWKFGFSTMAQIALYVGLDDEINMVYEDGFTLLVPPNRRFNRDELNVPRMLSPKGEKFAKDFILCHMILDNYYKDSVFARNKEAGVNAFLVNSFLGTHLWISTKDNKLTFQAVDVLVEDQLAHNGLFHGLDETLFPPLCSDLARITAMATDYDTSDFYRFFISTLLTSGDISNMFNSSLSVFAPTRETFAFFNNQDFNRLIEPIWVRHLADLLFNHISIPAMTREEYFASAPSTITMLTGNTYRLRRRSGNPRIESAEVIFGDMIGVDGYLHVIDEILTPPSVYQSIYDQSRLNPDFSLLVENIDFVQLTDMVDRDLPLTLLAPPNVAFERIIYRNTEVPDLVRQNLFRGLFFLDILANMTEITAENGYVHVIDVKGPLNDTVRVGGALIIKPDILARNGLLHHVDRVIGYDYPTVAPSTSPAPSITAMPTVYVPPTDVPVIVPTQPRVPISLPTIPQRTQPPQSPTQPPGASSAWYMPCHMTQIVLFSLLSFILLV